MGWGRALETAKYFETWVICGHWDQEDITAYLAARGERPGLHFCFVKKWWVEEFLKIGRPLYYLHYLPYHLWQRRAFKLAANLHRKFRFDLVNQVTITGYREPGYLWKLGVPFIWGPVGGTQNYPWRFLALAGFRGAVKEGLRTIINLLQFRFSPRIRLAAKKAVRVVAANAQVRRDFARVHGITPEVLPEIGVTAVTNHYAKLIRPDEPLRILWVGQFEPHKGFPLLVQALSQVPANFSYILRIIGAGPLQRRWQKMAWDRGIAPHCQWLGWLRRDEVMVHYDWAHLLAFTSLRETTGTVLLEALSRGAPAICLDHQGAAEVINDACGVKIPVTTPGQTINSLRHSLCALNADRPRLQGMSARARERAGEYLWSRNGALMAKIYAAALPPSCEPGP